MNDERFPISKVLVLDTDTSATEPIRRFCDANRLQALRVGRNNILAVLRTNVDLGAIWMSQRLGDDPTAGLVLARQVHAARPELPIFFRREEVDGESALSPADEAMFATVFSLADIDTLGPKVEEAICDTVFPQEMVRGIIEMTEAALLSEFPGTAVEIETPYIVRDRLIFGELFSLIPVDSNWCRGYMSLQAEEGTLQQFVRAGKTHLPADEAEDFRSLNVILGELTNLVWGQFRNRFSTVQAIDSHMSQVPLIINHLHRYISFGTAIPQLCFRCTLTDPDDDSLPPLVIQQRFVFNLNWSPEEFCDNKTSVDALVATGEIEFF
jgi:hypothetical protein